MQQEERATAVPWLVARIAVDELTDTLDLDLEEDRTLHALQPNRPAWSESGLAWLVSASDSINGVGLRRIGPADTLQPLLNTILTALLAWVFVKATGTLINNQLAAKAGQPLQRFELF